MIISKGRFSKGLEFHCLELIRTYLVVASRLKDPGEQVSEKISCSSWFTWVENITQKLLISLYSKHCKEDY